MTDITIAESAYLAGKANFEKWKEKFEAEWFEPLGVDAIRMLVASMPDEAKVELRAQDEEAYDYVMELTGEEV